MSHWLISSGDILTNTYQCEADHLIPAFHFAPWSDGFMRGTVYLQKEESRGLLVISSITPPVCSCHSPRLVSVWIAFVLLLRLEICVYLLHWNRKKSKCQCTTSSAGRSPLTLAHLSSSLFFLCLLAEHFWNPSTPAGLFSSLLLRTVACRNLWQSLCRMSCYA